jgi:hypothetical protein
MRPFILSALVATLLSSSSLSHAQSPAPKKSYVVMGSSTAAGAGASLLDSAWPYLLKKYYEDLGIVDTMHDIAWPGYTTYQGMPTGSPYPDTLAPDANVNVTRALSFDPDVVIVSYPSNDLLLHYGMRAFMSNLHTIYDTVVAHHKRCVVTSSQPRDDADSIGRVLLLAARDSILLEFPGNSVNFWDPVVSSDGSLSINPLDSAGDLVHYNNTGHRALFEAIKAFDIFGAVPLALSLISFTAALNGQSALLHWTAEEDAGPDDFIIQRSADGSSFSDLQQIKGIGKGQQNDYSWTDQTPLPGRNLYRLEMQDNGGEHYSKIVSLLRQEKGLNILKLYKPDGSRELMTEIAIDHDQPLTITITSATGVMVRQQYYAGVSPSLKISVPLTGLAAGQYFLTVRAADNEQVTRSFLTF